MEIQDSHRMQHTSSLQSKLHDCFRSWVVFQENLLPCTFNQQLQPASVIQNNSVGCSVTVLLLTLLNRFCARVLTYAGRYARLSFLLKADCDFFNETDDRRYATRDHFLNHNNTENAIYKDFCQGALTPEVPILSGGKIFLCIVITTCIIKGANNSVGDQG